MSTSGEVKLIYPNGLSIYFYKHWDADLLPETIAHALDHGRSRWNDEPYLARVLFSQMISAEVDGITGFGIDVMPSGEPIYVTIDLATQSVWLRNNERLTFGEFVDRF